MLRQGSSQQMQMGSPCAAGAPAIQICPTPSVVAAVIYHISQSCSRKSQLEDIGTSEGSPVLTIVCRYFKNPSGLQSEVLFLVEFTRTLDFMYFYMYICIFTYLRILCIL